MNNDSNTNISLRYSNISLFENLARSYTNLSNGKQSTNEFSINKEIV
jgi:hypothetical protein